MIRFANAEDDRNKVVSALTQVEARSAICRLRQEKKLTSDQVASALTSLNNDMKRVIEQPILPPVLEAANAMVERHYLRALDAVQLGCAVVSRDLLLAPDMRFIASDKALIEAGAERRVCDLESLRLGVLLLTSLERALRGSLFCFVVKGYALARLFLLSKKPLITAATAGTPSR